MQRGEQSRTSNQEHDLNHNHLSDEVASGWLNGRKVRSQRRAGEVFTKRTNTVT